VRLPPAAAEAVFEPHPGLAVCDTLAGTPVGQLMDLKKMLG